MDVETSTEDQPTASFLNHPTSAVGWNALFDAQGVRSPPLTTASTTCTAPRACTDRDATRIGVRRTGLQYSPFVVRPAEWVLGGFGHDDARRADQGAVHDKLPT